MSEELFQQDAETAVLSILLQSPDKVFELLNLRSFMFSSSANQVLFSTITELAGQGLVPEINLIDSFMKAKGRDNEVGGREYLNYLIRQNYSSDNVKEFERIVVNSYKARSLISLSTKIPQSVMSSEDIDGVIGKVRQTLDLLTETSGGENTTVFGDILKESWNDIVERVENPGIRGITTGLAGLDIATSGMNPGDEWIIAGRPGMGKTANVCNLILNQGKAGIPTLVFSLEMQKKVLAERLIAIETGISSTNIRLGLLSKEQLDTVSDAIKRVKALPIFIDSNYNADINYITSTTRRFVKLHGIKVLYLDYIQLLAERGADATNELGRISRAVKLLSNELGITSVVLSQLNREVEKRDDKRPVASDLRQSGNLEEDADVIVGLYRDIHYNKDAKDPLLMESLILKQRNGPVGMVPFTFEEETNKITDRIKR